MKKPDRGHGSLARSVSLGMAAVASLALIGYPYLLGRSLSPVRHVLLLWLLLGICGAFVHGLGYVPVSAALRRLISPFVLWPSIAVVTLLIVLVRI